MVFVKSLCFLLILALAILVQRQFRLFGGDKMCDLDDVECLTKGANNLYKSIVAGANGLLEPLDPIRVNKIALEAPTLKYTFTNATMSELKNCEIIKLKCNLQDSSFEYDLHCPKLFLYFRYEAKGTLGTLPIDSTADEKVTIDNYLIIFKGTYELSVSEKDKQLRVAIKSYNIDTEPKGKFTFQNMNLIRGDINQSKAVYEYMNANWRRLEKLMKSPIMEDFMKPVVENINIYLKAFPLKDVISQE